MKKQQNEIKQQHREQWAINEAVEAEGMHAAMESMRRGNIKGRGGGREMGGWVEGNISEGFMGDIVTLLLMCYDVQ